MHFDYVFRFNIKLDNKNSYLSDMIEIIAVRNFYNLI